MIRLDSTSFYNIVCIHSVGSKLMRRFLKFFKFLFPMRRFLNFFFFKSQISFSYFLSLKFLFFKLSDYWRYKILLHCYQSLSARGSFLLWLWASGLLEFQCPWKLQCNKFLSHILRSISALDACRESRKQWAGGPNKLRGKCDSSNISLRKKEERK